MAQLHAKGLLKEGEAFIHESIIGSKFIGRIEGTTKVGGINAIIPSIEGWARTTGYNRILIDDEDPFKEGFSVL
jgi:4-hydroxyproline epimerase